jgi:hypothetical protein
VIWGPVGKTAFLRPGSQSWQLYVKGTASFFVAILSVQYSHRASMKQTRYGFFMPVVTPNVIRIGWVAPAQGNRVNCLQQQFSLGVNWAPRGEFLANSSGHPVLRPFWDRPHEVASYSWKLTTFCLTTCPLKALS